MFRMLQRVAVFLALGAMFCFIMESNAMPRCAERIEVAKSSESVDELVLSVRRFEHSVDESGYDTEMDGTYKFYTMKLRTDEVALILIDVWSSHPNDGFMERAEANIQDKLQPLLHTAREAGILVVHASHGVPIHPLASPVEGEIVLDGNYDYIRVFTDLRNMGIRTLIYAGYASNMCVLNKPIGIIQAKGQNFNVILVRDASIAVESPESLDNEWAHKMAVYFVELNFGYTTTVEDFRRAVMRIKYPYIQFLPIVTNR